MSTVRLRRLAADYAKLQDYARHHPRVRLVQAVGDPPERYQIEYRIKSIRMVSGELQPVSSHLVEITLPLNYPRTPPQCRERIHRHSCHLVPVSHWRLETHHHCSTADRVCRGARWALTSSARSAPAACCRESHRPLTARHRLR